jgi:hypothetical protein
MKLNFITDQGSTLVTASVARRAGGRPFCACRAAWALETLGAFGALGGLAGLGGLGDLFRVFPGLVIVPNEDVAGPVASSDPEIMEG